MVWSTWQNAEYQTSPVEAFYSKLQSCNTPETEYTDYVIHFKTMIDLRTSCRQIKTIKATLHRDWELSKPATNMEAGTNELNQRLFALVKQ